jgi:hypothetical protein
MMSGVPLETCCDFGKLWNNKFYYKVASCCLFLLTHVNLVIVWSVRGSSVQVNVAAYYSHTSAAPV